MYEEVRGYLIAIGIGSALGLMLLAGVVCGVHGRSGLRDAIAGIAPPGASTRGACGAARDGNRPNSGQRSPGRGNHDRAPGFVREVGPDKPEPRPESARGTVAHPVTTPSASGGDDRYPECVPALPDSRLQAPVAQIAEAAVTEGVADRIGVYAAPADGQSPPLIALRADDDFPAASVIKVPVMLALMRAWENHTVQRDRRHAQLLQSMIQQSDNEDTNRLIDVVGLDTVNNVIHHELGSERTKTKLARKLSATAPGPPLNRASPHEVGELLAGISRRDQEGDRFGQEMLRIMRGTRPNHRTRIPQGIPPPYRARVANKTGTLTRVVNDAAIIETPNDGRYVLCIFMDGVRKHAEAEKFCREVAGQCWQVISARPGAQIADRDKTR